MFGLRHQFSYYACDGCGAVQIGEYPPNLAEYYPRGYYSISNARPTARFPRLLRWLRRRRASYQLGRLDPVGALLTRLRGTSEFYRWFRFAGVHFSSAILDVGCGDGAFLRTLREEGFTALEGVDAFTPQADRVQAGFVIRSSLAEVERRFDFVLFDDSFEHMPDPAGVLGAARRLCAPGGWLCLGLPVVGEAWELYQTDWVQLDPPRHFYLHTERSIGGLAARAGFRVEEVLYDSTAFQFWGSEQYRRDIPLTDARSHSHGPSASPFTPDQIRAWEMRAQALNRARRGDHATFFLRPS